MKVIGRTRQNDSMGTFSERFPVLYDVEERQKKADKVIAVCRHFSPRPLYNLVCLDLGASTGIMTQSFAREFRRVIAVDVDRVGLHSGKHYSSRNNIDYVCSDGTDIAIADKSIDAVICNQIYEHVDLPESLLAEIYRVLKNDGFCYFGAGNRYVLVEGHYFLPFLSWLPHRISDLYMKIAGKKGVYDVRLLSLRKLHRLTEDFWRHDYTRLLFQYPEIFACDDLVRPGNLVSRLPQWAFYLLYPMFPAWVWILTRKK